MIGQLRQLVQQRRNMFGIGRRPTRSDGVERRQLVVTFVEFGDQWSRVGIAHHRHQADLLAFGGPPYLRWIERGPVVVQHDGQSGQCAREDRPQACRVHEWRNGEPRRPLVAGHLVVDLGRCLVIGSHHGRHVGVTLAPQHPLWAARRAARAVHDEVIGRAGDPAFRIALCHCLVQSHRARKCRCATAVVDGDHEFGAGRRQHVGELGTERAVIDDGPRLDVVEQLGDLAWRVVVVDVHGNGARLQTANDQLGILVVVHDQRHPILTALPVLQLAAFPVRAEPVVGQEVREPSRAHRQFAVAGPPVTADGHRAFADDVGDGIDDVADCPLAHG